MDLTLRLSVAAPTASRGRLFAVYTYDERDRAGSTRPGIDRI